MNYIFDTHTLIWWACESEKLSERVLNFIKKGSGSFYISTASSWEVMIKSNIGKISFRNEWKLIIEREIEKNGFRILPIQLEHTYYLKKLKPVHKDPFDRMLIAQAAVENMVIITNDHFIRSYDDIDTMW